MNGETNKLIVPISIIVAGALIALGIYFSGQGNTDGGKVKKGGVQGIIEDTLGEPDKPEIVVKPVTAADHIRGSIDAKVKIVEYSDTECPFCKRYHGTLKQIFDEYGGDKVAWVYRHFPLDMHKKAPKEAEATECANEVGGKEAFWKYIDLLYATTNGNDSLDLAELPKMAEKIGLDVNAFNTCLNSGKYAAKINEAKTDGFNAGARGTPYTVLIVQNGRKTETVPLVDSEGNGLGALQYPALKKIIDKLLAQ